MIAASLLACHSASALRVGSIGTRLARMDPAVWTAAAGIAATTRLQREAVSKAVAAEKCSNITATAFDRNMKALGTVARSMLDQQVLIEDQTKQMKSCSLFVLGVKFRAVFELGHLLVTADYENQNRAASFSGQGPLWPKVTRLLAGSVASFSVVDVRAGMAAAASVLGFLGPGRLVFA